MVDSPVESELDRMAIQILQILDQHGGTAKSKEIRSVIGHEDTRLINYRKDEYLEPMGLIETVETEPMEPGEIPSLEWSLTEKGLELLDNINENETDQRDIAERIGLLEEQLEGIQEQLIEIQEPRNHTDSDSVDPEGFAELAQDVSDLQRQVNQLQNGAFLSETLRNELNAAILISGVVKDTFIEERGEEWFNQRVEKKRDEIEELL